MNRKKYLLYVLLICFGAGILLLLGGRAAVAFTEMTDSHYWKAYKQGAKGYVAPWYTDGLHIVDEGFITELARLQDSDERTDKSHNVIVIGSSLSAEEFDPEKVKLKDGYDFYVFAAGGGTWRSNIILDNLVQSVHKYSKDDIVKIEVSYSTFRDGDSATTTEKVIDKWGAYSVSSDLSVRRENEFFTPLYNASVDMMRMENVVILIKSYFSPEDRKAEIGPANYRNNYFDYEQTSEGFSVSDDKIQAIKKQLLELKDKATPVVEFSPISPKLQDTLHGTDYMIYIDETFIPWLKDNGIEYIDYRREFSVSDFVDGAHLGYDASEQYTDELLDDTDRIIGGMT